MDANEQGSLVLFQAPSAFHPEIAEVLPQLACPGSGLAENEGSCPKPSVIHAVTGPCPAFLKNHFPTDSLYVSYSRMSKHRGSPDHSERPDSSATRSTCAPRDGPSAADLLPAPAPAPALRFRLWPGGRAGASRGEPDAAYRRARVRCFRVQLDSGPPPAAQGRMVGSPAEIVHRGAGRQRLRPDRGRRGADERPERPCAAPRAGRRGLRGGMDRRSSRARSSSPTSPSSARFWGTRSRCSIARESRSAAGPATASG